ncbi:hypothetical protein TWF569_004720 [Orbilia oligospora]|nr:hypothetical protein TWF103_008677 [Orbilia oligospora]KAF3150142.1 hypothetical protein TWF594_010027 [Orbilia oligospora]KAF3150330.1 hypothetical protein TWF569_004720 [Orbilia oligospora]
MNRDRGPRAPPHQTQRQGKEVDTDDEESDPEPLLIIHPEEITIAIFCALSCESVAVKYALDEEFQCRPKSHPNARKYIYSFGQIGSHKVLIARPNQMGKVNAAGLSATISQQFPNIRFALMIGIGAGIPNKRDIRLGDVAVSIPRENHPGVIEYDFGKLKKDGFTLKGCLNKPPSILLSADGQLDDDERMNKRPFRKMLRNIIKQPGYERPNTADVLFDPSFHHVNEGSDCSGCEASSQRIVIARIPRSPWPNEPVVHRGLILSGSIVVKNPKDRDLLCQGHDDAICYEMEAAGIMDEIPCLVVRGISDYADTHKQDAWHCYAAAAAAAYGKAILCRIYGEDVEEMITIKEAMAQIETKVDIINQNLSDLQREVYNNHRETKHTEILEWVCPGAALSARHSTIVSARQAGTGKWFMTQNAFSRWLIPSKNSSEILWCYGIPGAGKSTISSVVIDYLEEQRTQDPTTRTAVAYFYFDFSNKEIDARRFTRNLLKQLSFQSPNFPQGLTELFKTYSSSGKTEAEDQRIEDLLIESASNFKYTYIVVDALDECAPEQRLNVLNIIQRLAGSGGARVFATSRPHPEDINEVFKEVNKIELGAKADDIRKYIKAEIGRYEIRTPKARHLHDGLRDRITDGLTRVSNGMFLLPKLQLKFLLRQATVGRIEATLDQILKMSASKGFQPIDETFDLMLESIDECNRDIADRVLSWLLVTKYPLRIQDLLVALAIEPGVFEIAEYQKLQQTTVLDVCAGFIVVDESSGIVKLAHQTVQGYLLRKPIDTADALTSLTKACLNYLRFHQFANPKFVDSLGSNEGTGLDNLKEMPFYLYALRNWEAQIPECNQDAIEEDLVAFLNHNPSIISYCHARKLTITDDEQSASNRWHWFYCIGTDESPLHIAARVGHLGAIKYFLSKGIDVNIKHNGGHQPVWEALAYGRIEAMKLLVENGSSPRTTWGHGRQLIHFASARGDYAAVKYLLEIDRKIVNIQQNDGSSPLRECAFYGHEDVACLLLDSGADWLLETYDRRTAGFISLEQGRTNIFSLFLKRGFSLKKPVSRGICNSGTPLHVAAGYGYQEVVKEILELGAINPQSFNISLPDSRGNTALHNAVNTGLLSVVQLLVENGIDIEKKNNDSKTALDLAIEFGYSSVERYLRSAILASSWDILELDNATTLQNSNTTSEPSTMADLADGISKISPSDIATVYEILIQKLNLPTTAARKIMDYAEYWVEQYVKKSGTVVVDETWLPIPYLHLNICGPFVRRIIFRTMSHDQGWSDDTQNHGTYGGSCTWIEVRKTPKDHNFSESGTKKADSGDKKIATINTRELQRNIHARWTSTEHINQWDIATTSDPELVDFLSNLSIGDRISLHPKAIYMGWKCYLDEAEMWVYSSPWGRQYS